MEYNEQKICNLMDTIKEEKMRSICIRKDIESLKKKEEKSAYTYVKGIIGLLYEGHTCMGDYIDQLYIYTTASLLECQIVFKQRTSTLPPSLLNFSGKLESGAIPGGLVHINSTQIQIDFYSHFQSIKFIDEILGKQVNTPEEVQDVHLIPDIYVNREKYTMDKAIKRAIEIIQYNYTSASMSATINST